MTLTSGIAKLLATALVAAVFVMGPGALGQGKPVQTAGEAHYLSVAQLQALVAKMTDGVATAPVPTGPGAVVLAAHRDRTGQVEVHTRLNDELIAQAGHARVLVGGTVEGNNQTAPGEWRGGKITGGRTYDLAPGDVIWIPAGMPHQMILPAGGSINYLAIKFETRP